MTKLTPEIVDAAESAYGILWTAARRTSGYDALRSYGTCLETLFAAAREQLGQQAAAPGISTYEDGVEDGRRENRVMMADILKEPSTLETRRDTLFGAIAHGDETHREWLRAAIVAHFGGKPVSPPAVAAALPVEPERKLWLWKNGDHYWAFDHLYPCESPRGDPLTLGEPVGYALLKSSSPRAEAEAPRRPDGRVSNPPRVKGTPMEASEFAALAVAPPPVGSITDEMVNIGADILLKRQVGGTPTLDNIAGWARDQYREHVRAILEAALSTPPVREEK